MSHFNMIGINTINHVCICKSLKIKIDYSSIDID